jgi:hypothetical protein
MNHVKLEPYSSCRRSCELIVMLPKFAAYCCKKLQHLTCRLLALLYALLHASANNYDHGHPSIS